MHSFNLRHSYPKTKGLAVSALFASLLSISSLISIPIPISPVPVTLQVFMVLLAALLLGPIYGTFSCLVYLVLGTLGLPVFAGASSGITVLLGPTGGYLIAFPVAALVGGTLANGLSRTRRHDLIKLSLASSTTLLIIYSIGVIWLSAYLRITLVQAILIGAVPFIAVDIVKSVVAIPIAMQIRWTRFDLPVNRTRIKST